MGSQPSFKLTQRAALLALIAAAYPMTGMAAAAPTPVARVDFAVGGVTATGTDGKTRKLVRGETVLQGDLVATADGRAQLRFTDGAYMSLQPQTEFRVDDYRFDGKADGSERGFFSLLKGGMRTITGLVGRSNRENYQVRTTVATIGIRGTEYTVAYTNSINMTCVAGLCLVANPAGSRLLTAGQSAAVASLNTPPVLTFTKADLKVTPPQTPPVVLIDPPPNPFEVKNTEKVVELTPPPPPVETLPPLPPPPPPPPPLLTGTLGLSIAFAHNGDGGEGSMFANSHVDLYATSPTTLNAQGMVTAFQDPPSGTQFTNTWSGSFANTGNDGIIAWGRWTNGTVGTVDGGEGGHNGDEFSNGRSLHYVVGIPTANMPVAGSATYTFLGGTSPTSNSGAVGTLTGGSLTAHFAAQTVDTSINFTLVGGSYVAAKAGMPIAGNTFSTATAVTTAVGGTGACGNGCTTIIKGFFAGDAAARAGLAYSFIDQVQGKTIGTAAFTKSPAAP